VAPFLGGALMLVLSEGIAVWQVHEPRSINTAQEAKPQRSFFRNMRSILKEQGKDTYLLLISIFLYFMAYESLQTGLTSFGVFTLGISPGLATITTALFAGSFIIFSIPSGILAARLGRKRMMLIGLIAMIAFFTFGYFFINGAWMMGVILVLVGIAWAGVNIGVFTGLYYVAAQAAAVTGPVLSGAVIEVFGNDYRLLWIMSALYVLLAAIVIFPVRAHSKAD
jgi:MFS family permease